MVARRDFDVPGAKHGSGSGAKHGSGSGAKHGSFVGFSHEGMHGPRLQS